MKGVHELANVRLPGVEPNAKLSVTRKRLLQTLKCLIFFRQNLTYKKVPRNDRQQTLIPDA